MRDIKSKPPLTGDQLITRVLWAVGTVAAAILLLVFDRNLMPVRTEGEEIVIVGIIAIIIGFSAYGAGKAAGRQNRDE